MSDPYPHFHLRNCSLSYSNLNLMWVINSGERCNQWDPVGEQQHGSQQQNRRSAFIHSYSLFSPSLVAFYLRYYVFFKTRHIILTRIVLGEGLFTPCLCFDLLIGQIIFYLLNFELKLICHDSGSIKEGNLFY